MGTQGLVTVQKNGKIVAKLTVGCNGGNAHALAVEIAKRLREADPDLLRFLMEHAQFGCDRCRVIAYRDQTNVIRINTIEDGEWVSPESCSPDENEGFRLWHEEFDHAAFNPRWERGSADHCVVVDLDRHTVTKGSYSNGKTEFMQPLKVDLA
jgi:hypothetical protein